MMMETVMARSLRMMFAGGMVAGLGIAALPAFADEVPVQRVEITGSSIKRISKEGALPVQTFSQEEIKKSGATTVADLIQSLPSMQGFTTSAQSVNGGGGGTTTASIHSIGEAYTLVLLNGRRMVSFGSGSAVNLNSIPLSAVERIEVLTDGASALYGSDAIAGVVNFILKKDQTQWSIDADYQVPQKKGGTSGSVGISKGWGDVEKDGYNVLLAYSHDEQNQLNAKDREFANTGVRRFSEGGKDYALYQLAVNTSPASATLTLTGGRGAITMSPNFYKDGKCAANTFAVKDPTAFVPSATSCWFDFSGTVQLIPETRRDSFFGSFTKKLTNDLTFFSEAVWSKVDVTARFAPPAQGLSLPLTDPLYATYITPYLGTLGLTPADISKAKMNLRIVDAGGRQNKYGADTRHLALGVRGSIGKWDFETSYTHSAMQGTNDYDGGYLGNDAYKAIRASGKFDPFAAAGGNVALLAPAVLHTGDSSTDTKLQVFAARASTELFKLGGGNAGLGLGYDHSKQGYFYNPSAITQGPNVMQPNFTNTALGSAPGALPVDVSRKNQGLFAELELPFTKEFSVTGAARYDSYSKVDSSVNFDLDGNPIGAKTLGNSYSKGTYKIAARWKPIDTLLIRGSYGTGFRAPTLNDIAAPISNAGVTSGKYACPFANLPSDPRSAGCMGVTQYDLISGGNPLSGSAGLKPETSKQFTVGVVFEAAKDLSFGFDLWDVRMKDQIINQPEQNLYDPKFFAQNIGLFSMVFDSTQGLNKLVGLVAPFNAATSHYQGVDWNHNWRTATPLGKLDLQWTGTWTHRSEQTVPGDGGDTLIQSVGRFDENNYVALRLQSRVAATLKTSDRFTHVLAWNYKSGYQDQTSAQGASVYPVTNGVIGANALTDFSRQVKAYNTFDWQTKWTVKDNLTLTGGILNIFDENPPLSVRASGGGNQAGYDGRYSSPLGRTFYPRMSTSFK
ncbi:MAG: TonB-dependent receptor [Burkholderiales bacterium]|nr:TonB-dependent receptor [Burkholderiales bacterium]